MVRRALYSVVPVQPFSRTQVVTWWGDQVSGEDVAPPLGKRLAVPVVVPYRLGGERRTDLLEEGLHHVVDAGGGSFGGPRGDQLQLGEFLFGEFFGGAVLLAPDELNLLAPDGDHPPAGVPVVPDAIVPTHINLQSKSRLDREVDRVPRR